MYPYKPAVRAPLQPVVRLQCRIARNQTEQRLRWESDCAESRLSDACRRRSSKEDRACCPPLSRPRRHSVTANAARPDRGRPGRLGVRAGSNASRPHRRFGTVSSIEAAGSHPSCVRLWLGAECGHGTARPSVREPEQQGHFHHTSAGQPSFRGLSATERPASPGASRRPTVARPTSAASAPVHAIVRRQVGRQARRIAVIVWRLHPACGGSGAVEARARAGILRIRSRG